jgi:hypothetical protein
MYKIFTRFFQVVAILLLLSCSNKYREIGHGWQIIEQGGSKLSLSRNRHILLSYVILGFYTSDNLYVFEYRPLNTNSCHYVIYNIRDDTVEYVANIAEVVEFAQIHHDSFTHARLVPLSNRTCSG